MPGHRFIFSPHWPYWLARHLAFWLVFSLWYLRLSIGNGSGLAEHLRYVPLLFATLPVCMMATYGTLYILIPRYLLAKRYRAFATALLLFAIAFPLLITFNPLNYILVPWYEDLFFAPLRDGVFKNDDLLILKRAFWDGLSLMLVVSGYASVLRLMILYTIENSENKRLQQQKVDQDLQLIKSQLNSRFLFNTLQAIEVNMRSQSPESGELVLRLSDLLSYVLYENEEVSVTLNKEIEIIEHYLRLEQEGCGENISVNVTRNGEFDGLHVVPLLLLPLVESCFEGSQNCGQQRRQIDLDFNLNGVLLNVTLKVHNLRALGEDMMARNFRISNVAQRLHSFYNGRHQLDISTSDNNYVVQLALNLR
jgi:two-component system LytT family sensor kinase